MNGSSAAGRADRRRHQYLAGALAVVVALVAATAVAAVLVQRAFDRAASEHIDRDLRTTAATIGGLMEDYTVVLLGTAAWIGSAGWPDAQAFHHYVTSVGMGRRHPGVQVVGAAPAVARGDLDAHIAATEADPGRAGLRYPKYYPYPRTPYDRLLMISLLEPLAGNTASYGLDFYGEAHRRAAAEAARDTGEPQMSAPVTLVQETGHQRAVLIMVPIYRQGAPMSSVDERWLAFAGVAFAAFRPGDLVRAALGSAAAGVRAAAWSWSPTSPRRSAPSAATGRSCSGRSSTCSATP